MCVAGIVAMDGDGLTFTNKLFADNFMTGEEMTYKSKVFGILPVAVWSRSVLLGR